MAVFEENFQLSIFISQFDTLGVIIVDYKNDIVNPTLR